jgi:hypothetical protein
MSTNSLVFGYNNSMTTVLPNEPIVKKGSCDLANPELTDSHLIEGVPYIGQKTNFHCCFASLLMILQYYGINITLHDLLYHAGTGYSLHYLNDSSFANKRLLNYGYQLSYNPNTCEFLADIYGLSHKPWVTNLSLPDEERWNEDWPRIKENISNDVPVMVRIDAIILASDNLGFGFLYPLLKLIPYTSLHLILLIGFNVSNQSVCYNDPFYGLFNNSQYGTYRWFDLEKFKTSTFRTPIRRKASSSPVNMFYDIPKSPLTRDEAFNTSHKRNIERLKGNFSVYSVEDLNINESHLFGIDALKRLRKDFYEGLKYRIKTFYRYKLNNRLGIGYSIMDKLYSRFPEKFPFHPDWLILELNDCFENIGIEKKYFAEYLSEVKDLLTDDNNIEICKYESVLFEQEAENWTKLAEYYSEYRERGIFMPLFHGIQIIEKMANLMDNITSIEQSIIDGPFEK